MLCPRDSKSETRICRIMVFLTARADTPVAARVIVSKQSAFVVERLGRYSDILDAGGLTP